MSSPSNQVSQDLTAAETAAKAKLLAEINAGKTFWSEHKGAITLAAGGYAFGFAIWALMNAAAFYIAFSRVGFKHAKPGIEAIPSADAVGAIPAYSSVAIANSGTGLQTSVPAVTPLGWRTKV